MKKIIMPCLWAAVSLALPFTAGASELYGKISYKGAPLKNAEITLQDKKTRTNDIGFYSLDLAPGAYTLDVKLPDGKTAPARVDVYPQDTEKNLKFE